VSKPATGSVSSTGVSQKTNGQPSGGTTAGTGNSSSANPLTSLPLIPWEGGPAYWSQFPITKAAGWTNPNFFPFGIWFNGISSNAQAQFGKSYGINTYFGMDPAADYNLFANNGIYILEPLNNTPAGATAQPGDFLGDELDGKASSLSQALSDVQNAVAASGNDGRFNYFNFTQIVVGNYGSNNNNLSGQIVDAYPGPASVDNYWYTMPNCTGTPSFNFSMIPIDAAHCRTASSYGVTTKALRARNVAGGGPLKPIWNFVENLSGAPDANSFYAYIAPGQLEGATMSSVINEARGIFYFNQSFAGSCTGGSILSEVEYGTLPCAAPQMSAMRHVDSVINSLAPVINTQSYQYTFGSNLNTMLKWYAGSAYIFAMISGDASSEPGARTFTLPSGLAGASSVTVLNENRTMPVGNGTFTDNFAAEYTYHIYKVTP
jgi:hypothetical protein